MRGIVLIITLIVITIAITGCLNMKDVQVIEFAKDMRTLPYLRAKINGEVYESDKKGQILINKGIIIERIEVEEPYKIAKINRNEKGIEIECEYIKERYAGYIYETVDGKTEMKLVLLNLPEAKGIEVIQEPEMRQIDDNEKVIKLNKQSRMIDEILKIKLEREGKELSIYALLGKEEKEEIILEEIEVNKDMEANILSLKVVDKNGAFIYVRGGK